MEAITNFYKLIKSIIPENIRSNLLNKLIVSLSRVLGRRIYAVLDLLSLSSLEG